MVVGGAIGGVIVNGGAESDFVGAAVGQHQTVAVVDDRHRRGGHVGELDHVLAGVVVVIRVNEVLTVAGTEHIGVRACFSD